MKRFMLTMPAFVAATLLVEGSIITDEDLGTKEVPVLDKDGKRTGEMARVQVRPPRDAIEVDAKGNPVSEADASLLAAMAEGRTEISAVQPRALNPTETQGVAPQPAGDVQLAASDLPADPAAAPAPGAVQAEEPKRRGGAK